MATSPVRTGRFGWHLTLDGYRGEPERLGDFEAVRARLDELPHALAMDKLIEPCVLEVGSRTEKDPGGITGFVLIAQSHLSIHTFPRRGFVSVDVFTCHDHFDRERIRESLVATFELGEVESSLIPRGTRCPLIDLGEASLTDSPGGGMTRAASEPATAPACCLRARRGVGRGHVHQWSASPCPAGVASRPREIGTAIACERLAPAGGHGQP